ncbi:hypothetical protein [Kordia sp.]|uniref:hypothetical protein n=1 Tax=Kordia sp. TaxID=1965332 RepID=UPI003D279CF7
MPTVSITSASIYNAAVKVTGVLTGSSGVPITAYTVEVIPPSGTPIRIATNVQSSGGNFEYCGTTTNNEPIPDASSIRVITNRQAQDQKSATQPSSPTIGFLPLGSYQQTCRNITVTLACDAQDGNGSNNATTLNLTNLVNPDVWNNTGNLEIAAGYQPQDGFQPGGSWKLTSSNITVTLNCEAQKIDGSWVSASFDLTNVTTANLWNDNGVLKG